MIGRALDAAARLVVAVVEPAAQVAAPAFDSAPRLVLAGLVPGVAPCMVGAALRLEARR